MVRWDRQKVRYSERNDPPAHQTLRHRVGRMAAVLRDLALGRDVVRARSVFRGSDRKPDLDGKRGAAWHRCLARVPTLALAPWIQAEILFASNLSCRGVRNRFG